ncbi:MAG: MFS transporter [Deltaproteobacteria bacterium]|nr:MFS transporter [Deltaproteobacteria bacterium]
MKSKIYYGWWVVLSMIPANLVHAGAMFYIFGIFYDPLLTAFGWNRSQVATALSIYLVTVGFSAPVAGRLTDRFGPRKLIGIGAFIGGIAFFFISRITSLWEFYFLYFIQGLAFAGCGLVPVTTALANWFDKKRGTAIGIAMTGISLGAITITPVGGLVLENFGWQTTYLFLALISWILVLPPVIFVMRDRPEQMGLFPDGMEPQSNLIDETGNTVDRIEDKITDKSWKPGQAIRSVHFWLISMSYLIIHISFGAILTHQIVYLTDKGISMASAAVALALTGGIGGAGKLFFGYISDKSSPRLIAPLCAALQAIGIVLLLLTNSMAMVWVSAVVFGFCMGGHAAIIPVVVGYIFGVGSFGAIYGMISIFSAMGIAIAPILAGVAYETLGNYFLIFSGCILASVFAAILLFWSIASISEKNMDTK